MLKNWVTWSTYVDLATGEIISKEEAKQNYTIVKIHKKYEHTKTYRIVKRTIECRRTAKQGKLF